VPRTATHAGYGESGASVDLIDYKVQVSSSASFDSVTTSVVRVSSANSAASVSKVRDMTHA